MGGANYIILPRLAAIGPQRPVGGSETGWLISKALCDVHMSMTMEACCNIRYLESLKKKIIVTSVTTKKCANEALSCAYNDDAICKVESAYQGVKNVTREGVPCISWDKNSNYRRFGNNNHCRATKGHGPWCYKDTSWNWSYCFNTCPAPATTTTGGRLVHLVYFN